MNFETTIKDIRKLDDSNEIPLSHIGKINAGFASPAEDFSYERLDLNKLFIKHPEATYLGTINGNSLQDIGIFHNDTAIIDKCYELIDGKVYLFEVDGEITTKILKREKNKAWLTPANESFKPILVTEENKFLIWGRIIHTIRNF